MVYAKARREDMTPDEKRAAKKLAETLKSVAQAKRHPGVRR